MKSLIKKRVKMSKTLIKLISRQKINHLKIKNMKIKTWFHLLKDSIGRQLVK